MAEVVAIDRLAVQTVLYENSPAQVKRALMATCHAIGVAQRQGVLGQAVIRLGDCGVEPLFSGVAIADAEALCDSVAGFEYVYFGGNLGHGGGHNRLLAQDESTHILIINPDAQLAPDTLATLARRMNAATGIVEARQLPLEHPKPYAAGSGDTSWASGACLLISAEAFAAAGGFDSASFFLHGDDVDLSWRVRLAGYRVVHEPRARVSHHKRINPDGTLVVSDTERFHSAVASVLLAHKFSRSDISRHALDQLRGSTDPLLRAAASDVERRLRAGHMPEQIDPGNRVSSFGPYYSPAVMRDA